MEINRDNLSLAREYAVASEICRKNFYAQITLGHLKRTDILVFNTETGKALSVEVKTKQKKEWPGVKGTDGEQRLLVFVDLENKNEKERPDFYILDAKDWQEYLKSHVINNPNFDKLIDGYIPLWKDKYKGTGVRREQIVQHKEKWEKLARLLT